ncbi:MAG: hypothetical protein HKN90_08230 [Flavobacteriaceae bacterium]|nr:hypothetical protein [Flavobacteriaceae bacterium]
MEITEVTAEDYSRSITNQYHIFNSPDFNELNSDKCDLVYYLLFKDSKVRLGIILGVRGDVLISPFSSPFGGFDFVKEDIKIRVIDESIKLLRHWSIAKRYRTITITLPPSIYDGSFVAKQANSLFREDFRIVKKDLNYSFALTKFNDSYSEILWRNARKNLKAALRNNFEFKRCSLTEEKKQAYNIIRQNREERGFPIRMSWEQIKNTIDIIPADFFIVTNLEGVSIAAAMVFHVARKIVQVVYWGDLPKYSHLKTMNYLSFKIFEYYKATEIKIIDIGPSTENSIPNHGLCEFKESIGCNITTKLSFTLEN